MSNEFYIFTITSDPKLIDSSNINLKNLFPRIYWTSSIFNFYPYQEIYMNDQLGLLIDTVFFVEGLKITTKLGTDTLGFIEHDYCWSENQINNTSIGEHIAGDNIFLLLSNYYMLDLPQSRAWMNESVSNVIIDIIKKDFNLQKNADPELNKVFIDDTDGFDNHYQFNVKNRDLFKQLAAIAVNKSDSKSPYVTFFNTKGEFYFTTINTLLKQQPVVEFDLSNSTLDVSLDPYTIKQYDLLFGGLPVNKDVYKIDSYKNLETGESELETSNIETHFYTSGKDKLLITRDQQKVGKIEYFGVAENTTDKTRINGLLNSKFLDSMLSYRMTIVTSFFTTLTTGKVVKLNIKSALQGKQGSTELSGNWLIIKDEILYDKAGLPSQKFLLAKSGIQIDTNHSLNSQFLS